MSCVISYLVRMKKEDIFGFLPSPILICNTRTAPSRFVSFTLLLDNHFFQTHKEMDTSDTFQPFFRMSEKNYLPSAG